MADPISITASVASILTISIQTCRYLGASFSQISEAPKEAEQYQLFFRALIAAFCELRKICGDSAAPGVCPFPPDFKDRLESCKEDLEEMQAFVDGIDKNMKGKKMKKTWTRISYVLFADERLKKFMNRLQMYQATFMLDLMTVNS